MEEAKLKQKSNLARAAGSSRGGERLRPIRRSARRNSALTLRAHTLPYTVEASLCSDRSTRACVRASGAESGGGAVYALILGSPRREPNS